MLFLMQFEGRKFEALSQGRSRLIGFLANRRVEAADAQSINIDDALNQLVDELKRKSMHATEKSTVAVTAIFEFEVSDEKRAHGFTFFPDESAFRRLFRRILER